MVVGGINNTCVTCRDLGAAVLDGLVAEVIGLALVVSRTSGQSRLQSPTHVVGRGTVVPGGAFTSRTMASH